MTLDQVNRINRILNDLVKSITTDIAPIIQPTNPEGGYFGVPRMILCYVDFLGLLLNGWSGKKDKNDNKIDFATSFKGKSFIANIFSKIDDLYSKNGNLLYEMYRHGTVHIFSPKKMVSRTDPNKTIEWLVYKGDREQWDYYENRSVKFRHLQIIEWEKGRFILPVSIVIFYKDLLVAIDLYRKMIFEDKSGQLAKNLLVAADGLDHHYDSTLEAF